MNSYLRLLQYIRPYAFRLCMAIVCTIVAAACNLYLPWIIKDVVDEVLVDKDMMKLNLISASIILVFIVRGFFFYGQHYLMSWVGQKAVIDIRADIFRKLQKMSLSYYDKNKTGTIMSYATNDVTALQVALVEKAVEMVTEGLILVGSICAMLWLNWRLTLLTFCTFPVVLWFMDFFGKKIRLSGGRIQECTAELTAVLQEVVSSTRIVKSFVREDYEIDRFERQNRANFSANMKNIRLSSTLTPMVEFIAAIGVTVVLWYGGRSVIDGVITAGELIAFLVYAVNIANPLKRLTRVIAGIQKALAAGDRVFAVFDMEEEIKDLPGAEPLPKISGNVEFDNVSFAYTGDEVVLKDLKFNIGPGQVVALVGPSGAGKSTVASLIPRFYDVTEGSIKIDGRDIRNVTMTSLREQVGIVPQETILFNGTVFENILYGRLDATKQEVVEAAKSANAHDFIMALSDGYETILGDRGVNISGGQRQRIAIARAILKNPQILILDEATSALDTESEHVVQEALDRLMVGRTSFVISHRLSTIQNADRIIVLENGHMAEDGSHSELMSRGGLYAHLYEIQYSSKSEE
ncbi:MAG: ABC transporter ATP-binding protein/permease [Phascolarctobacterium sp.]|nr:ABC transporter ATP-binding protein/permease [Phascolarctobacterium sp.]